MHRAAAGLGILRQDDLSSIGRHNHAHQSSPRWLCASTRYPVLFKAGLPTGALSAATLAVTRALVLVPARSGTEKDFRRR